VIMGKLVDTGFGKQVAQRQRVEGRKRVNQGVEEDDENGENKREMQAKLSSLN